MSLGYALLHRNRIRLALEAGDRKRTYDDLADFAFGVMGAGDLGSALQDFAQSRNQWFEGAVNGLRDGFLGESGPFSFVENLLGRMGSPEGMADLAGGFLSTLGDPSGPGLKASLHEWVDKLCNALPDMSGQAANNLLKQQIDDITLILERPLLSGRRDIAAHRAFRAAVTMRQYVGEALEQAPWASADFDIKSLLCQLLHQVIGQIDDSQIAALGNFFSSFQDEYGGFLNASFRFGGAASASSANGPQGMAGEGLCYLDEVKAAPHEDPGAIWGLDLATNILATFFMIWESVRSDNYKDRWFDGTLSVLTILWQGVHTLMRAAWPGEINRARGDDSGGNIFKNWIFTDQGNFGLNLLIRLFQSFHDGTASNWALSFAQRSLKYFSNVTIIRTIYYFARSVWYFQDRRENRGEGDPEQVSLVRILWAVWGPMSWISMFFSFFTSWDDFSLENGWTARTIVLLVLGLVLGLVMGYVVLGVLADENPFAMSVYADWWTMSIVFASWILAVVALIIILADLESGSKGAAIGGFVAFAVLIVYGMIGLPTLWGEDNTGEHFFLQSFLIFSSIFTSGVLPFFLWWFFIDDGRDKHSLFEGKDANTSPYKLPYTKGENWLCGQGCHGIFSHIPSDLSTAKSYDNEYAYDFNEKENRHALVARNAIVLDVVKDNENGSDSANSVDAMHTSWHEGHDPGTDDERVLTYSTYYHLSQNHVWVDVGHRLPQGMHLADIDSTGRSAQHHLHYHAEEYQRRVGNTATPPGDERRNTTVPIVFKDPSTHGFRNFPFLAWVPGKGHIEGKPLSMAYYTSDNEEQPPLVNPMAISLDEQGASPHEHWILIDKNLIENGPLPESMTVRTTVAERHFHETTLSQTQLADLVRMREPSGFQLSEANGHRHAFAGFKYIQDVVAILSTEKEEPEDHTHWLTFNQNATGWNWGALPATHTFTLQASLSGANAHHHEITLDHGQLFDLLRGRRLPASLETTQVSGHTHRLREVRRFPSEPEITIVEPMHAQLFAENPGPYNLVGDQMVIRINERATEFYFYGAHRPRLQGEIALDRGLDNTHGISIDGTVYSPPAPAADTTVQGSMVGLNAALTISAQARIEPVIVLETLRRGSGASIVVDGSSSPAFETPSEGRASGVFPRFDQVEQAQLASHFHSILTSGWPAAPGPVTAQVDANNHLELQLGGAAIAFPDKKTRNSDVLRRLYDPANSRLRATGDIPLASGRIDLTNAYGVPVPGTAAQVEIDVSHAAFAGNDLTATSLEVTVRGRTFEIALEAGDNDAPTLARKIARKTEGVMAWESAANRVKVQTVGAGGGIQLAVRKRLAAGDFQAQNTGDGPALTVNTAGCVFNGHISDSNALAPNQMCALVHDAIARSTLPYDAAAAIDRVQMDGNRLVIRVNTGHTVSLVAEKFSGGSFPFALAQNGAQEVRSHDLGAADMQLDGPGWVELQIDGHPVIVPFDAEPARVDLVLKDRLPASGEKLVLNIHGTGNNELSFTGSEGSVEALAEAVASHFADLSVRLAYRVSFENMFYGHVAHKLELNDAPGLAMAGFLDDRTNYTTTAVSTGVNDQMAVAASLSGPLHLDGLPVKTFTVSETPSGSNIVFHIGVAAGFTIDFTSSPPSDPFNITGGGTSALATDPVAPETELPFQCLIYNFEVKDASSAVVANSLIQIAASPAMVRSEDNFSASLPDDKAMPVTVVEPGTGDITVERAFSVDMTDVGSLEEAVHRLNAGVPAIRAWIATPVGSPRLHMETRGNGHGWKLRLGNPRLLLALGFTESQIDFKEMRIQAEGRGDVRNGAKATQEEIRNAFRRIDQCATQPFHTGTATGTPRSLQIQRDGAIDLVLSSVEGAVTIETEPASIRQALNVTEANGRATIAPATANVALDCGIIVVKADGRSVAAVRLFADHATVTADEPLATAGSTEETKQLGFLKAHEIEVTAGSAAGQTVGPLPASVGSLPEAVGWYAENMPNNVWIGIDATSHVVLQTRRRGDANLTLELDFSNFSSEAFSPGDTLLGFAVAPASGGSVWQFSGQGFGNVLDLDAVPVRSGGATSIEGLLTSAVTQGAARQAVYDAEVDTSATPPVLRVRSQLSTRTLNHPAPAAGNPTPGGIQFSVPGGGATGALLEDHYSLTPPVRPGELSIEVTEGTAPTRSVISLIAGAPARLAPLEIPSTISVLDGKGFDIVLTDTSGTTTFPVQFSGVTGQKQAAALVERQCQWKVRATIQNASQLVVESVGQGTVIQLRLQASATVPNAVTNNADTGFTTSPGALPLTARGGGTVPDMAGIEADHYKTALLEGFISETSVLDSVNRTHRQLDWGTYEIRRTNPPSYLHMTSQRNGCMSSLEPVVCLMKGVKLNCDLERAPAIHASVLLSCPEVNTLDADTFNLPSDATLRIELNDNGNIEGFPGKSVLEVPFPAGDYTVREAARRIHEDLFNSGAGRAAAYPDGKVVVETAVPGLAGSIRIPAGGTVADGADQALLQKLTGSTASDLKARGWPGVGFGAPGDPLRPGYRSKNVTNAQADAQWNFSDGTATATVTVSNGDTLQAIQSAVDSALASATVLAPGGGTKRIGICLLGPDDTLYIEATGPSLTLEVVVNGNALATIDPGPHEPGGTPERAEEPAVGLRRTSEIRTFLLARDYVGDGDGDETDNLGWIRTPAFANSLPAAFDDLKGSPAWNLSLPFGRYLTAARADASKTLDYHESGEMVISGSTHPDDEKRHFVHQVRYWIQFASGQPLGIGKVVRNANGTDVTNFTADFLWVG